jgi:cold shock CspA family protein
MKTPAEFFTREKLPIPKTCFVLMPFEEGMNAVYEHGIKPLVESLGIQCRRADELYSTRGILGDIWESLQTAEFIIADLTNKNPNVMYELGLCHALWKHMILICQNKDDVPFDLRAWRVIWYDFTFAGAARLKDELQRAIEALRREDIVESELKPLTTEIKRTTEDKRLPPTSEWIRGEIQAWYSDKGYGFVRAGEEVFYFNLDYLFSELMEPMAGKQATFIPLEALPSAQYRRASKIFVHETRLSGRVTRIMEGKGYGFADVSGQSGEIHSLFVLFQDEGIVELGSEIEFEISDNPHGPIGRVISSD